VYLIGFETGVMAKLFDADELMFLLAVVRFDLGNQHPAVTFALAGYALYILRINANAFYFHRFLILQHKFTTIYSCKNVQNGKNGKDFHCRKHLIYNRQPTTIHL
jgi:hypothetical protein